MKSSTAADEIEQLQLGKSPLRHAGNDRASALTIAKAVCYYENARKQKIWALPPDH
jgi:hypothetical protein